MNSHTDRVHTALRRGDVSGARALLDAHEGSLDAPEGRALEALVRVYEGRAGEALELLAPYEDRGDTLIALARGEALLGANDARSAVRVAEALVARAPGEARAHAALGRALHHAGDALRAARSLQRAGELAPSDPGVLAPLGGVLLALGRVEEARGALERALAIDPLALSARQNLATLHSMEGRHADVLASLEALARAEHPLDARAVATLVELAEQAHEALRDPRARSLAEGLRARGTARAASPAPRVNATAKRPAKGSVLARLGRDLVALARKGALDPVYGREVELDAVIDVLLRKKKANPVLVGPAGAGKTAVVELLAQRIAKGEVPARLRDTKLVELSVADLIAGSAFRGELEERLAQLVDELRGDRQTVLFVDELHTLVGAGAGGGTGGGLDAVEALKPALARGEIALIGATTAEDYERSIARDPALARRLSPVAVDAPGAEQARAMLAAAAEDLGAHHGVTYEDDAVRAAAVLCERFVPERAHPDKGVEVLDGAGVRAVRAGRARVRADEVCAAVASLARIPEAMVQAAWGSQGGARAGLAGLAGVLRAGVLGHDEACGRIAELLLLRAVSPSRAAGSRPRAVFALAGPAGCGKRTLVRALARALRGDTGEDDGRDPPGLLRVDMALLAERHELARLVGAPAGYTGYGEGGWLTRALRSTPGAVVLLDAPERAHPDALALFATVFDTGRLVDGRGVAVDARQATFVLVSDTEPSARATGFRATDAREGDASERAKRVRAELTERVGGVVVSRVDEVIALEALTHDTLLTLGRDWWSRAQENLRNELPEGSHDLGKALPDQGEPPPVDREQGAPEPDEHLRKLVREALRQPRPARFLTGSLEREILLPLMRQR